MPEPYGIETAGSFGIGNVYIIVSLGDTNWNQVAGTGTFAVPPEVEDRVYKVGAVIEAVAAGSGTGTARRLNAQLGRIGGKLLADNLLRDGIDLAVKNTVYDDPVLYLKVDPEVKETISAGSFVTGIRYRIRTLGTTNFLLIGSLSNTVGTIFTATGPGTGTGTADVVSDSITDTDGADALDPTSNQGSGSAVGFNTDTPAYDLDINNDAKTTNIEATSQANISNIIINAAGYLSTIVGPLYISPAGHDPVIEFDRMTTDNLYFSDNTIGSFSNSNIEFNPSGTGTIELEATTNITGDFNVTGSVTMNGNLATQGSIAFGDSTFTAPSTGDTLDFNTFISQDLNPGIDNEFNLGSPTNKWGDVWAPDWTNATNLRPSRMRVSDQQILDGVAMEIRSLQSNDNLVLNPATGILYVEELKFEDFPPTAIPSENLAFTIDNPNAYPSDADIFGYAVDASTSYFIVGAHQEDAAGKFNSGKAYIFDVTTGSLLHTLDNPDPSLDARFGYSVGITESYAIVGAYKDSGSGNIDEGIAYIYSTATGGLLHTLNNPNPSSNDRFGWSVSIAESYAIVGAYGEAFFSGAAYIYDTATGTLLHTLNNPNADPTSSSDSFGISVSITDTHAIVGASSEDDGALTSTGKAYIFTTSAGTLLYTLNNPTPNTNDLFGWSVSVSDSYAAVGAYLDTVNGYTYIYDLSTGGLLHSLVSPFNSGAFGAQFGISVSITDDYTVVGAPKNGVVAQDSGRAYIYDTATGLLLHTLENPNAFNTSGYDLFGYSVAVSDTCIVVGAYFEDDALPGNNSGKAYVFGDISPNAVSEILNLNATTPVQFASTGAGYLRFMGTNAVLIPAGDDASRPSSPEIGDTRWNTDQQYLECFDGSVYVISTGGGEEVTEELMEDLGNVYSLILG